MNRLDAIEKIEKELLAAEEHFGKMASYHEGAAILREEFDELWDEVKRWPKHDKAKIEKEAKQLAAMALRFMVDLC